MPDTGLPLNPSRDNDGSSCELVGDAPRTVALPDHITPCSCDEHHGVCAECGFKISVGPSGREYGHGRATNLAPNDEGVRRDCPNRPLACNPGEPHAWGGYDREEWNRKQGGDASADW